MAKAVIYARISQNRSGDELGVTRQIEDCRRLATERDLELHEPDIKDNDVSAYRAKERPGWTRLIELLESGSVNTIICWHPDRLYRRLADLEQLVDLLDRRSGLKILTVSAGEFDLNQPTGRMIARVAASIARMEVEHKAERQARKNLQMAEGGEWKGGRRPYGYEADGVTILESEAKILREAARRLILGRGLNGTTSWVESQLRPINDKYRDEEGNRMGDRLSAVTLKRVLTAPRIAGWRQHWSQKERERWDRERRDGLHDGDELPIGKLTKAEWNGVLTEDDWRSVRAAFARTATGSQRRRPPKFLLSGLLVCGP